MINRSVITGRLTRDIELKYLPNGVAVANFTVAVNRSFKNADGEQEADFINVVVFKKQAENAANYVGKGSLVGIDGRIQTRNYENKEGQKVYVTEIIAESVQFLESKSANKSNSPEKPDSSTGKPDLYKGAKPIDISDDDLPF